MDPAKFTHDLYEEMDFLVKSGNSKSQISNHIHRKLMEYLDQIEIPFINEFEKKYKDTIQLLKGQFNGLYMLVLKNCLPKHTKITDMNSVVMGVPTIFTPGEQLTTDLDFTIEVRDLNEQEIIIQKLATYGFVFKQKKDDNKVCDDQLQWYIYHKFDEINYQVNDDETVPVRVEIEVKIRDRKVMSVINQTHFNMMYLSYERKLKISYIKTLLQNNKELYTKFKYIVYSAMFEGCNDSLIFLTK